jgi:hypothetical protein
MIRASLAWALTAGCLIAAANGCGGSKSSAPPSGSLQPNVGTASIGPLTIDAGGEETVCIVKRLDNTEDIMATSFVADLAPGSHHLIVYKSTDTEENLTPFACSPFVGLIDQTAEPLMLVNKLHLQYDFPPNVGMMLPAGQMLRIEAHYINTTAAQITGQGNITVHGIPTAQATGYQNADFGFWGTTRINIPAKSAYTTPVHYQGGLAGSKIFGLTTHQHQLGTRVQVWQTSGLQTAPADSALVMDEQDWSNPALKAFDPPLSFDGTDGFSYQCSWQNSTDQTVSFGESALDEMCFVGFYYYPSQGFDICVDGHCFQRPNGK